MIHLFSFNGNCKALIVTLFLFNATVFGQNLVLNPSFESVNPGSLRCSWYLTAAQFNAAINNWSLPTGGSTDIFNTSLAQTCYCHPLSTNAASVGQQVPRTGNGYSNIVTYGNGGCSPWREYLQGQLSAPLVVGTTYEVELWVTLADKMSVGSNNIGVKFSQNPYSQGGNCGYYTTPDLNYIGPIIVDKQNWVQIIFCYTPTTAGLDNFIIGNFYNDGATTTAPASGVTTANTIMYYVDDVRIEAIGSTTSGGSAGTNGSISLCASDPAVDLFNSLGGAPDNTGTWSGPSTLGGGYLGTFDPSINVAGTYTYSAPGGSSPCAVGGGTSAADVTLTLINSYDATITPVGPFCTADAPINLSAVDPGGTWSGSGVTDAISGTFDPAIAGIGTFTITYSISGACGDIQTTSITINSVADATITPVGPLCSSDPLLNLSAVNTGGLWSGPGITNGTTGTFDPAAAGNGTHTITYSILGACGDVQTTTITINPAMDATITPVGPFCALGPALNLIAIDPGGAWSGTGITNPTMGTFDPASAGIGAHTITYAIGGSCGDVQTTTIIIGPPSDATITSTGPFCTSDPVVQLSAFDPGGTWSGTGITNATMGTFDPAAAGAGTHTITYSISGACGDIQTTVIVVNAILNASIIPIGPFCENDPSVQLTAVDMGGTWTGAGITDGITGIFDPSTAGVGTHTITYTISGACGDVQSITIDINPLADATITSTGPFCTSDPAVQLSAFDPGGTWSGTGITNATTGTFDPAAAGAGMHTVTYTISGQCGDMRTTTIVVNAMDDSTILPAGPFCLGSPSETLTAVTTLGTWSGLGIIDPSNGIFDISVAGSGSHLITYVTNGACPNTGTIIIDVHEDLIVTALQDATICEGETANISATVNGGDGNYIYSWVDQNMAVVGTGANISVSPTVTTTYTVIAEDGCTTPPSDDAMTITVIPIPVIDFSAENVIGCAPLEVIFANNSTPQGTNCQWDFGDGLSSTNGGAVTNTYTAAGCYDITLSASVSGCVNSLTQANLVCVVEDPIADFTVTPETFDFFDPEFYVNNSSLYSTTYSWDFGDGTLSTLENPSHQYAYGESDYSICLTAYNDYGCESELCKPISIDDGLIFYIPNTFTPDGDQFNQTFQPVFTSGFDAQDFNLLIYDRWGEVIWESNDASVGWDGTYNGNLVQDGTYVWKLEFKVLVNDERIIRTGHVNVTR